MFAVSKEPFDCDIFSSLFSFSLLDLYIYHPLSDAYYTTFDTWCKGFWRSANASLYGCTTSSSRHLPTKLNIVQTAQIKDLLPFWVLCVFKRYWKLTKDNIKQQKLRQVFQRVRFCARWRIYNAGNRLQLQLPCKSDILITSQCLSCTNGYWFVCALRRKWSCPGKHNGFFQTNLLRTSWKEAVRWKWNLMILLSGCFCSWNQTQR